jgi:hypothetical protein
MSGDSYSYTEARIYFVGRRPAVRYCSDMRSTNYAVDDPWQYARANGVRSRLLARLCHRSVAFSIDAYGVAYAPFDDAHNVSILRPDGGGEIAHNPPQYAEQARCPGRVNCER